MSNASVQLRRPGAEAQNRSFENGARVDLDAGTEIRFIDPPFDQLAFRPAGEDGADLAVDLPDGSTIVFADYIAIQLAETSPPRIVDPANPATPPTIAELLEGSNPALDGDEGQNTATHGRIAPLRQFSEPGFDYGVLGLGRIGGLGDTILEFPAFLRRAIDRLFEGRLPAGPNTAPAASDDAGDVFEDGPATAIAVLGNDTDQDGDPLTIIGVAGTGNGESVSFTSSTVIFDPNGAFEALTSGAMQTESLTYTVSDGNGGTDTANVTVTVIGENEDPVAIDDAADVSEDGGSTAIAILGNDTDPEGDPLTVVGVTDNGAAGTATFTAGDISFDPAGAYKSLGSGETATESLTYTVSDGNGGTDTANVTVTVIGQNDGPGALNDTASISEDSTGDPIDVLANDTDPDGDPLTVIGVSDNGAAGTATFTSGDISFDPAGAYESLSSGQTATETLTYTVSDGNGGTDTANVTVTVAGRNDDPTALNDTADVSEDGPATAIAVLGNDTDPDGDPLTVIGVAGTGNGESVGFTSSAVTYDPNGAFEDLASGATQTENLTYTVSDGNGATDTANVTVTIQGFNDDPIALDDTASALEDGPPTILSNLLVNDTDPEGDPLFIFGVTGAGNGESVGFTSSTVT